MCPARCVSALLQQTRLAALPLFAAYALKSAKEVQEFAERFGSSHKFSDAQREHLTC